MNSRKDTTRKLNIETLAKREVFAANVLASMALPVEKIETMIPAWHNVDMPSDVNRDGAITPMDALFRINSLNQDGARKLPASKPASAPFYDANGDDWLSPVDAIAVINELNKTPLTETVKQGLAGKGADVAEKVDQHNAKPNPGFTIAAESLAKINSVKLIHQSQQDNQGTKEEQIIRREYERLGRTKENLHAQKIAEELGLNEKDTEAVHDYADKHKGNDFNLNDLHLLAGSLLYDTTPSDAKRSGLPTLKEIMKAENHRQDLGIEKPLVQLINEANTEGDKDSEPKPNPGRPIDDAFRREVRKQLGLAPMEGGTTQGALQEERDKQTWGRRFVEKYLENNPERTSDNEGNPLETLEGTEAPQKPAASLEGSSLPESNHPTAQDGDPYANGLGADWQDTPGMNDSDQGNTGSNDGSGSGENSDTSSNNSPNGNDGGGSNDPDGPSSDPSGIENDPSTASQDDSDTANDPQTGTEKEDASDNSNGGDESTSGPGTHTTKILGKSETGGATKYIWMTINNAEGGAVFGETTYTPQADGTYREEVSWFGANSGEKARTVSKKFDGNFGDSTDSNDGDTAYFGVKITGPGCDGMNPWTNGKRKAPERITQNPGDIDPINPNFVDAVMSAEGWAQERWAREGLGKPAPHNAPSATPNDNPNSEADGHTCPESGEG